MLCEDVVNFIISSTTSLKDTQGDGSWLEGFEVSLSQSVNALGK